jgi:hypothetical protein
VCGAILTRGAKDKNGKSLGEAITNPRLEEYVLVSQDERRIEVRRRAGRNSSFDVRLAGEMIRIHGRDVAVDAIYS